MSFLSGFVAAAEADAVDGNADSVVTDGDAVDGSADSVVGEAADGAGNSANLRGFSQGQAAELLNVSERSVSSARIVVTDGVSELGRAVERGELAVSAAAEIARLPKDEQRALIEAADPKVFSAVVKDLRARKQAEKKARRVEREAELGARQRALPDKRYGVILADPEWRYEPWDRGSGMDRAADNHYPTSELAEIKARGVPAIAADDCVLFLWATVPMLREGLEVLAAWGFDYRTHLVWHKLRVGDGRGPGYWFHNEHEILLVGVKGSPPCPAPGLQWPSLIAANVGRHSEKPSEFLDLIDEYFPSLPKIELNARARRDGWDAWGLEAPEPEPEQAEPGAETADGQEADDHAEVRGGAANRGGDLGFVQMPGSVRPPGVAAGAGAVADVPPLGGGAPRADEEPELPTFLRRGHPDCPVGAASGQQRELHRHAGRDEAAGDEAQAGELRQAPGLAVGHVAGAGHQRPPEPDTTNERNEFIEGGDECKGAVASCIYGVETLGQVDPGAYRRTPAGEATVPELLPPGTIVATSYGTGPYIVVRVRGPWFYDPSGAADPYRRSTRAAPDGRETFPHWSLELCRVGEFVAKRPLAGSAHVNECVAVGGRVLHLFAGNDDEVIRQGFDEAAAAAIVPALALRERVSVFGDDGSVTAAELAVLAAKAGALLTWRTYGDGGPEWATVTWFGDDRIFGTDGFPRSGDKTARAALSLSRIGGHVSVDGEWYDGCSYSGSCMSLGRVRKFLRAWGKTG